MTVGTAISKFRREEKLYFGEISLGHLEDVGRISKKYVASLSVCGHKLVLATFESFKSLLIVALDPARLI